MEAVVVSYNRHFAVGSCKDKDNKIYIIHKAYSKKSFDYLVVGEKIKGVKHYNKHGRRMIKDIEPLNTTYHYETHPEIHYVCV
jgi:hypothetical protein